MAVVLLDWVYIFFITLLTGLGFFRALSFVLKKRLAFSFFGLIVCGVAATTVYVQFLSLFCKIGLFANLLLICTGILTLVKNKSFLLSYIPKIKSAFFSWEGLFYIGMILFFAFCTSRGTIHTDTSLYHAQAIRWYEEYGVVKGLGNLQWHFAYNSSYFAFAALFSMKFLGGPPLHCTTGFIAIILVLWSLYRLRGFFSRRHHMTDMCYIGILFYALVNMVGFVSPASDYATMFMALYLVARWSETIEENPDDMDAFALLSVFAVYVTTLKLSAGLMVFLVVFPLVYLVRTKRYKEIAIYFALGVIALLPFIARNIIISGWLLYPFAAIDLFDFDWKMPVKYVNIDSATIKTWGRCLNNPKLIDMPIREWFPIWWETQERYAQMLVLTNVLAVVLGVSMFLHKVVSRAKICWNKVLLIVCLSASVTAWFLMAPFIRYGLAFLLALPLVSVGIWMTRDEKDSFYKLFSGCIVFVMFFTLTPYWDRYFTDDLLFIKRNLMEPYYIVQKDYDTSPMTEFDMNGVTVYSPTKGDVTGYKYFPSSTYDFMIQCTELRGETLKDGFRSLER